MWRRFSPNTGTATKHRNLFAGKDITHTKLESNLSGGFGEDVWNCCRWTTANWVHLRLRWDNTRFRSIVLLIISWPHHCVKNSPINQGLLTGYQSNKRKFGTPGTSLCQQDRTISLRPHLKRDTRYWKTITVTLLGSESLAFNDRRKWNYLVHSNLKSYVLYHNICTFKSLCFPELRDKCLLGQSARKYMYWEKTLSKVTVAIETQMFFALH